MCIAIRFQVSHQILAGLYERLHKAYATGQIRPVERIHALLYILENRDVAEVAKMLNLSPQSIYNTSKPLSLTNWIV
jgi:hypothetical protein